LAVPVESTATDVEARAWIRRAARRLRDDRLDELTALAVSRVKSAEPEYAQSLVSLSDLNRCMRRTLALALTRVTGDPIPGQLLTAASEVGRLRAEQGLSLPALLHSYRIDLRVIWEAIVEEGRAAGFPADDRFLECWILVWEAVEANTAEVVDAYRQAREDMSKSLEVLRERAFEKLALTGETDASAVREASKRLGLPLEARYLVVVGDDVPVDHGIVVASMARLKARGLAGYLGWVGDEFVGIVLLAGRRPEDVVSCLDTLHDWRCGATVTQSLPSVPQAVRLARAVIASLTEPGIQLLHSDWPAVLVNANEELATALADQVLGPLLALPENDRAAVFETLEAYLQGTGSVAEVAAMTLRHRNTVRNRLQTVERVTGLSLARPQDVGALVLAMAWRRGPVGREAWG
jgi:PucR C-terminal helix-turn-helix domain